MVANVTKINSARSVVSYFSEDGYYAAGDPEHRKASRWHGRGAAALRLGRHVSPKRFAEIMRGEAPKVGVRLGTVQDGVLVHEAGRDVTLSAPKSVSLAALVDGDKRVVRAHDEAVRGDARLDRGGAAADPAVGPGAAAAPAGARAGHGGGGVPASREPQSRPTAAQPCGNRQHGTHGARAGGGARTSARSRRTRC